MKSRRNRAIEKAKLPNERVQLVDKLDYKKHENLVVSPVAKVKLEDEFGKTVYEGYTVNMNITVEEKDITVTSPYTTPTPPSEFELNKIMEGDLPEEKNENLFAEIANEVNEKQAKSALVKVKDFFKGIFK